MEDAISQGAAAHEMEQGQEAAMNPEGLAWSGVTGTASPPQLFRLRSLWSKSGETVAHLKNCRHRFCLECEELGRVLLGNKTGGPGHGELYRLSPEHSTLSIKQRGPSSVLPRHAENAMKEQCGVLLVGHKGIVAKLERPCWDEGRRCGHI